MCVCVCACVRVCASLCARARARVCMCMCMCMFMCICICGGVCVCHSNRRCVTMKACKACGYAFLSLSNASMVASFLSFFSHFCFKLIRSCSMAARHTDTRMATILPHIRIDGHISVYKSVVEPLEPVLPIHI